MRNGLMGCHPAVSFAYFCLMLGFCMAFSHPLCRLMALLGAGLWLLQHAGREAVLQKASFLLPLMLLAALLNPLLSHAGVTILAYLPTGNPLTLEAICYGLSMSLLLGGVILWFSCFERVMTGEKLKSLFGKRFPALTLLLVMSLGLVPRFRARFHAVSDAQQGIGMGIREGSLRHRLRCAGRIFAVLLNSALEDAIETADSMKSRGYGEPGRTMYSPYVFSKTDKVISFTILTITISVVLLALRGSYAFSYYPALRGGGVSPVALCAFAAYLAFCLLPWIIERWEEPQWRSMKYGG